MLSANPVILLPANVETFPDELILRINWLPASLTYKLPLKSAVTRYGLWNCATPADPSINPAFPSPANVDTVPDKSILRILWLAWSATYKLPLISTVTPYGLSNWATPAEPFKNPIVPLPANIERFPDKSILRIMSLSTSATYKLPIESIVISTGL